MYKINFRKNVIISTWIFTLLWLALSCFTFPALSLTLNEAASGKHRSAKNIARNDFRNPVKTLDFFQLRKDMTVVELWPGSSGWYTEILAPYLKDNGLLYTANFDGSTGLDYFERGARRFQEMLDSNSSIFEKVINLPLMPPKVIPSIQPGTVDLVLTFRNMHNWLMRDMEEEVLSFAYSVLKPNGIFGVVAHRSKDDQLGESGASTGYLGQTFVIDLVESSGFKLVEVSDINSNLKDSTDHPKGVWTLPPRLRLGEESKEHYNKIGESNRMTLKFVKLK